MKKLQLNKMIDSRLFLRQTAVKLFQTINRSTDSSIQIGAPNFHTAYDCQQT